MWRSYHKGVKKEQAQKFWTIQPKTSLKNVIAFQKSA
jgi:hypothetical protein